VAEPVYDVAILGSGVAGSMLAAILARNGAKVLLVDQAAHPKFAIGESTIPNMLVSLRTMAERYDVPELLTLSTFTNCHRVIAPSFGVKNHFGFFNHQEGQPQDKDQVTMFNFPKLLHETAHLYRQDTDAYLFYVAIKYGAEVRQNFPVVDVEFDDSGVTISSQKGDSARARYVVDASGFRSPLATKLKLREEPCRFKHHSRSIWNHMIDVPRTDAVFARPKEDTPPVPWYEGTVHHLFPRGWFWVIGFDNHPESLNPLCSVGLTLDPRKYPRMEDKTPEEEFWEMAGRYPDVARQFEGATPMREWVATGRLQYSSKQTAGDRWALLSHAAAFLDPLFSRGLSNTCQAINALSWRLLRAFKDDDFSAERFADFDVLQQALFDGNDNLVNSAFIAFEHYDLWTAVFRIWAWGSNAGTFRAHEAFTRWKKDHDDRHLLELEVVKNPGLHWSDHEGYNELFMDMVHQTEAFERGDITAEQAADNLYAHLGNADFVPRHFGWTEREKRFINPTPKVLAKTMWWAATQAPPDVRRIMLGFVTQAARELVKGKRVF
jgi:tetracycline 7-halogenase / FADH2 O2-dependent halogenase